MENCMYVVVIPRFYYDQNAAMRLRRYVVRWKMKLLHIKIDWTPCCPFIDRSKKFHLDTVTYYIKCKTIRDCNIIMIFFFIFFFRDCKIIFRGFFFPYEIPFFDTYQKSPTYNRNPTKNMTTQFFPTIHGSDCCRCRFLTDLALVP